MKHPILSTLAALLGLHAPSESGLAELGVRREFIVLASREGRLGHETADGTIIRHDLAFASLPSRKALGRKIVVEYKSTSRRAYVPLTIRDVGPHNTHDPYWLKDGVPAAAKGKRQGWMARRYGPPRNRAGIDLSDVAWQALGIPQDQGLATVTWYFVD